MRFPMQTMPQPDQINNVDYMLQGGRVLAMDTAFSEYADGAIAVKDGRIAGVGSRADLERVFHADRVIDAGGGIILPGLVNTHCHAAMTLFRGLADDRALADFLATVWKAEEQFIDQDSVRVGAMLGCVEMALGGITTFADMYWHPASTLNAAKAVGLNIVTGPVFVGFAGADRYETWQQRLAQAEPFVESLIGQPGVHPTLAPHGCYTLDEPKLRDVAALCRQFALPMQTHASEASDELRQVEAAYGRRPISVLRDTGLLDAGGIIAHAVHLSDQEIALISEFRVGVAHCPLSNARVIELIDAGVEVGLGTDGASTGNDLDLWKAMRFFGLQQRLARGDARRPTAREIVAAATIQGARALGLGGETGSIEPGKRADLIVVSTDSAHMQPIYDPYAALAYGAGREDVRHVIAGGEPIVAGGRPVCVELAAVASAACSIAARISREEEIR